MAQHGPADDGCGGHHGVWVSWRRAFGANLSPAWLAQAPCCAVPEADEIMAAGTAMPGWAAIPPLYDPWSREGLGAS